MLASSTATAEKAPRPVARKEMSKFKWTLREMRRYKAAYAMIAPYYLIFATFTIVPVILSFLLSFTSFDLLQPPVWVGLDNYLRLLLDDEIFLLAVQNTFLLALLTGPAGYLLSFCVAWFINELSPRVRAVVTLIFFAPSLAGGTSMIFGIIFAGDSHGIANAFLLNNNWIESPILFFRNESWVIPLVVLVALWGSLGAGFLGNIAGLQVVDRSLYEAGAVDGVKNRWQELWYITLPSMKSMLLFSAIMSITGAFGIGGMITSLAGFPTVNYRAHTIMHHLDDFGGMRFEIGYASAIATILFILMIGANVVVQKMLSKLGR